MASETLWANTVAGQAARFDALKTVIDNLPNGVALLDAEGKPIIMNKQFVDTFHIDEKTVNYTFDEVIEHGILNDFKEDPRNIINRLLDTLRSGRDFMEEMEFGDRVISLHSVLLEDGNILVVEQDVTSRVVAERRVDHLAHHDVLTNLPNRASFTAHLAATLEAAAVKQSKFAILSVDLDRFKDINDIFGHSAGDALLHEVASRFKRAAGTNFLARLGGDEFTFICQGNTQPEAAAALADALFEAAAGEMEIDGRILITNLSVGVAVYPDDGDNAPDLLNNADAALYRAKADGRGTTRFYEPAMDQKIHEQRLLQQDLRVAVARKELALCYQPQATVDGEITGFEALTRWCHPTRGLIMPSTFVPIAEQSGLIIEIGEWILREACREAASWTKPLQIAVNLSPIQFRHGDLALLVHEILLQTGLPPHRLEIEITESVLIENFSRAIGILRRLKAMGVRIAMDDFGTGYSSLSYLQSFPFDKLKIDQSFIARIEKSNHAQEIIRAVIGLGRGLNLPIVAEGVETQDQLSFLSKELCSGVQGYLIGRPETIAEYADITGSRPARRKYKTAQSRP